MASHVTGSTYSGIIFCARNTSRIYARLCKGNYAKDICKGIGKIQFVSELTILLNLQISKFSSSLYKEKKWDYWSLNATPDVGKLTLV